MEQLQPEFVADEIERIRELGITWGMSDDQIDACLYKSLEEKTAKPEKKPPSARRCGCFFKGIMGFFVFMFVAYNLMSFDLTGQYMSKVLQPYAYPIFRLVRLAGLPLTRNFELSDMHDNPCLITNPWFSPSGEEMNCNDCKDVKEILNLKKDDLKDFKKKYLGHPKPILVEDTDANKVSWADLQALYGENKDNLNRGSVLMDTSNRSLGKVPNLMEFAATEQHLLQDPLFHTHWMTTKVTGAHVFRSVFTKPYFVPADSEVALEKSIVIDSPESKSHTLVQGQFSNIWYHQAWGKRTLVLYPLSPDCLGTCKQHRITLTAPQVLFFDDGFWRADSIPLPEHERVEELSIAFIGRFY